MRKRPERIGSKRVEGEVEGEEGEDGEEEKERLSL